MAVQQQPDKQAGEQTSPCRAPRTAEVEPAVEAVAEDVHCAVDVAAGPERAAAVMRGIVVAVLAGAVPLRNLATHKHVVCSMRSTTSRWQNGTYTTKSQLLAVEHNEVLRAR